MADSPQTLISWNFENWLTVVLMAVLGFMLLGLVGQGLRRILNKGGNPNSATPVGGNVLPMDKYMTRA